jgi:hypothetical protein
MKTKTWSAILSSDAEEKKYLNTIQQALCTDSQQVTFRDTDALLVDCCILKVYNKDHSAYYIDRTAFNRVFTTQTFGRLARRLSLRHGDRPSRPSQTDQDAAGQSFSFCKGTSLFRSCYNASFLTG